MKIQRNKDFELIEFIKGAMNMNKKILFSPVGGTDPMSEWNYHDGALLHIARHYKPDEIYLYMSKEILQKHEQDDRYRYCIKKLGERLNHVLK